MQCAVSRKNQVCCTTKTCGLVNIYWRWFGKDSFLHLQGLRSPRRVSCHMNYKLKRGNTRHTLYCALSRDSASVKWILSYLKRKLSGLRRINVKKVSLLTNFYKVKFKKKIYPENDSVLNMPFFRISKSKHRISAVKICNFVKLLMTSCRLRRLLEQVSHHSKRLIHLQSKTFHRFR
jgi:hypothetical protein